MKFLFTTLVVFFAVESTAHERDITIESANDLRDWCEASSHDLYVGQGIAPYNWSASYWEKDGILNVKGSWRIDDKEAIVECQIAQGAAVRNAVMSVHERK